MKKKLIRLLPLLLALTLLLGSCQFSMDIFFGPGEETVAAPAGGNAFSLADIPAYRGDPYVAVNNNIPYFTEDEITAASYEMYSELDSLGRCGVVMASVGRDLMPTAPRESISSVKPTGWKNQKYDFVDGQYVYNRCHLLGFQLTGENANERNLITGTRYMNVDGMLPFENMIADYVKETGNHVVYRVTPIFEGNNLVASGVLMEAVSVEDGGDGVTFCVYCYNVQPGVDIDYSDGSNRLAGTSTTKAGGQDEAVTEVVVYILNVSSHKFHLPSCSQVASMSEANKETYTGDRDDLLAEGYSPCGTCKP